MKLEGKVAIVTGAGSGIGKATALLFGREGAKVVVATRTSANGDATTRAIRAAGGSAHNVPTDVSKASEVQRTIQATIERFGRLDILFNNAGLEGRIAEVAALGEDEWDYVMGINLKGTFLMSKFAIPHIAKTGVDIISVGALTHSPKSLDLSLDIITKNNYLKYEQKEKPFEYQDE